MKFHSYRICCLLILTTLSFGTTKTHYQVVGYHKRIQNRIGVDGGAQNKALKQTHKSQKGYKKLDLKYHYRKKLDIYMQ